MATLPAVQGVEHRLIRAGGVRVHVAEAGDQSGVPVLLLHGWPQHWYMWRRVIEELGGRFRLIAPDLRGFGWTEAPGHGYDPETFARDQIALLDALGIERAAVIGHDWGGFTAFLLGLRHPARIERLLVLNAPHPWPQPSARLVLTQLPRSPYLLLNAAPGIGAASHRLGSPRAILRLGARRGTFSPAELDTYTDRLRERERARAMGSLYRWYARISARVLRRNPYEGLRLSVPTRLVFGIRDRAISPRMLDGFEPHADDMELELVPDAGHFIVDERPELVVERALRLLS